MSAEEALKRMRQLMNAWRCLRRTKVFHGFRFSTFGELIRPRHSRDDVNRLQDQLIAAMVRRDVADALVRDAMCHIVCVVRWVPEEDVGELYEALGFVSRTGGVEGCVAPSPSATPKASSRVTSTRGSKDGRRTRG